MNAVQILIAIIIAILFLVGILVFLSPKKDVSYNYQRGLRPSDLSGDQIKNNGWFVGDPATGKCVVASPQTAMPYVIFNNTDETFTMSMTNMSPTSGDGSCPTNTQTHPIVSVGPSQTIYWENAQTDGQYSLPFVQGNIIIGNEAQPNMPICTSPGDTNCVPSYTIEQPDTTFGNIMSITIDKTKAVAGGVKSVLKAVVLIGALF